jgi:mannose-6-phosphate isomerase-like protein (cupin superfamily)
MMPLENPLVDIRSVEPLVAPVHGWDRRTDFRIGISGADGSSTVAYRAVLPAGASRIRHVNNRCEEILFYLEGEGVAGEGKGRARIRRGHCQRVPQGVEHFFKNTSETLSTTVIGFYIGAPDLASTGFEARGPVTEADLRQPETPFEKGLLVHLDNVEPAAMSEGEGWLISDFRISIGRHNGASSTLFHPRFLPGSVHKKHRHEACEEIYYLIRGVGVAGAGRDRVRIHAGQFHFVPAGVEHFLYNAGTSDPIVGVGVYIGAGSVEETGYVYMGDVVADDVT